MILASAVFSQYTYVTDDRQTDDDDRQHLIPIAKAAMQLQHSVYSFDAMMWKRSLTFFREMTFSEKVCPGKWLSLTHKVLTTSQPSYLCDLISVQPPHSTQSSSVVAISRPPTSSSLKITSLCIRYSAPYLWNQLPKSFLEPHTHLSISVSQSHFLGHARSPFHQRHHCCRLSPLLSFTSDS